MAIVRAPLIEAQLVETYLLSTFAFQTTMASKAARCVLAAEGRPIVEFGSRRAHSPEAGMLAGRAAYIGGCAGTSNTEAGMRFGIPVFGTAAHSWTMAFPDEEESFRALQKLLGEATVFLIDTYDTLEGARLAASLGRPMWGVRLDSGDLERCRAQVREILDDAGLQDAKIMATNDLDEYRLAQLVRAGAPIEALASARNWLPRRTPHALSAVYKMVELGSAESVHYTAKFSGEKSYAARRQAGLSLPACDMVAIFNECNSDFTGEPLLRPVISNGALVEALPSLKTSRDFAAESIAALPHAIALHSIGWFPTMSGIQPASAAAC